MDNETAVLDSLQVAYKSAVEAWIVAIRNEESLRVGQPFGGRSRQMGTGSLRRGRRAQQGPGGQGQYEDALYGINFSTFSCPGDAVAENVFSSAPLRGGGGIASFVRADIRFPRAAQAAEAGYADFAARLAPTLDGQAPALHVGQGSANRLKRQPEVVGHPRCASSRCR